MSEPFLERLTRFTPNAAGLDRDALLFAAGRSSARPNRGWKALATALAGSQVLSLVVLWPWPKPDASPRQMTATLGESHTPRSPFGAHNSESLANPGLSLARRSLREPVSEYHPPVDLTLIDSGLPLRAAGAIRSSVMN